MRIIGKILTEVLKCHKICTDLGYWRLEALTLKQNILYI